LLTLDEPNALYKTDMFISQDTSILDETLNKIRKHAKSHLLVLITVLAHKQTKIMNKNIELSREFKEERSSTNRPL
jgi:hypothetical protein